MERRSYRIRRLSLGEHCRLQQLGRIGFCHVTAFGTFDEEVLDTEALAVAAERNRSLFFLHAHFRHYLGFGIHTTLTIVSYSFATFGVGLFVGSES